VTAPTRLSGTADGHRNGPRGAEGGHPGMPNRFLISGDGEDRPIEEVFDLPSPSKFANLRLEPGQVFVSRQGGGGGFGDPRERAREAVREDVSAGYVSRAQAEQTYGREERA
jgi:N-methylhydantoinase B/oxoprolinase/acetone carboxylase alpha subunit